MSQEWIPVQGVWTSRFGEWLTHYLKELSGHREYLVYYDHGDSQKPNVAEIKGFYGQSVKNRNRLTDIDIMVANQNRDIVLLIEIEETAASPKKYIGSAFAALMCNSFAVKMKDEQRYFRPTNETIFIIAGKLPNEGIRLQKMHEIIAPRVGEFVAPVNSIAPKNIVFEFADSMPSTIELLKKRTAELLSQNLVQNASEFDNGSDSHGDGESQEQLDGSTETQDQCRMGSGKLPTPKSHRPIWQGFAVFDDDFDLKLTNPEVIQIDHLEHLLNAVETAEGCARGFNKEASHEFRKWFNDLENALGWKAYGRLSSWFLGASMYTDTSRAAAAQRLWDSLFCATPERRLIDWKRGRIDPPEFAIWWQKQLKCQRYHIL